jgi:transposase InsO family protein
MVHLLCCTICDQRSGTKPGQVHQHVRGAPAHPQTQGKIERWHQTMKNRILLENYYLPGALEGNRCLAPTIF